MGLSPLLILIAFTIFENWFFPVNEKGQMQGILAISVAWLCLNRNQSCHER